MCMKVVLFSSLEISTSKRINSSQMTSPSHVLSLDCKPHNNYSMLPKSFDDPLTHDKTKNLEDFLSHLEEERLKIDVFKGELPLCIQLLTNVVEMSKQQLKSYKANEHKGVQTPVLEEFMPIKQNLKAETKQEKTENVSLDKANWMTSAQLWCQTSASTTNNGSINNQQCNVKSTMTQETDKNNVIAFDITSPKLSGFDTKPRNGGAFLPSLKDRQNCEGTDLGLNGSNDAEIEDNDKKKCFEVINDHGIVQNTTIESQVSSGGGNSNQTHRKARRCWSPDLHRRFVNALQMLGGSQVATPKQIRELMKVDGLTNDEVKSHLQKYRLHTRRPMCTDQQGTGTQQPQLVVLGGIWVPQEYASAAAHNNGSTMTTLYNAAAHHVVPHAPSHYCTSSPVSSSHHQPQNQIFYPSNNNNNAHQPLIRHHHAGQLLHMYNSSAQTHTLSESNGRGVGDQSDSIEDGKSESQSGKEGESQIPDENESHT